MRLLPCQPCSLPRRAGKRCRALAMKHILGANIWVLERLNNKGLACVLDWVLTWIFALLYIGSDQEIHDGIEFALDESVEPGNLTTRQIEVRARISEWVDFDEEDYE